MSEEKIELKSEEIPQEQETPTITAEETKENPMLRFPWTDEEKVDFKYADLHIWCRKCDVDTGPAHPGNANIQTGLFTQTKTDNQSYIAFSCPNCGEQLVLHFRDAANPPSPEEEAAMEEARLAEREARLAAQEEEVKVPEDTTPVEIVEEKK